MADRRPIGRAEIKGLARAGAAGAAVSLALWAQDLLSLRTLQFAGVSDTRAQDQVLAATGTALAMLEAKLLLAHVLAGFLLGALCWLAVDSWPRTRRLHRRALTAAACVLVLAVLAHAGMMGRYPQIYADRWWLTGGWRASAQRLVTHTIGPVLLDAAFLGLLAVIAGGAFLRLTQSVRTRRQAAALSLGLALAVAALTLRTGSVRGGSTSAKAGPSVLVLASDSLRADRLEDAKVMPFTASLLKKGAYFPFAFTPIARTFQSWVSILTGLEPRHHGIRTMFPAARLRRDLGPTFVSTLRDRGYRTFVVSDFAGDIFPRFRAGFDVVDAPNFTADALARSTVLNAHGWSLPLLRLAVAREWLPEWRNLASLSDPEWLVDRALQKVRAAEGRPFVGVVFFSTPHFPYVAPYPDFLLGAGDYRGPYLYHAPPASEAAVTPADITQIRARYDGALTAVDRATARLMGQLGELQADERLVLVVLGDHGEELYEEEGIAGHGDILGAERSQSVPIFLSGPGVPAGRTSRQVRVTDLAATLLGLVGAAPPDEPFGDGHSLFTGETSRPVCVETGIWFWPDRPVGLRGRRLQYAGIAELLEMDPATREIVLRDDRVEMIESAKRRGLVLGDRLWSEQLTPRGHEAQLVKIAGVEPQHDGVDLRALFEERCVAGDPRLMRLFGGVVYRPDDLVAER